MRQSGLTVKQCHEEPAERLCVSPATVKGWKLGNYSPIDIESVCAIAKYFNIALDSLLVEMRREDVTGTMDAINMADATSTTDAVGALDEIQEQANCADEGNVPGAFKSPIRPLILV